jgi:multiple sugar transport system permease protein
MRARHDYGRTTLLFLLPWLVIFSLFEAYPIVASFVLSFTDYNPLREAHPNFIGLANYREALATPAFWRSLRTTAIFVLGTIPATTVLSFLLASLVHAGLPARGLFRAGFFVPSILSLVVISLVFQNIYAPYGGLNTLLQHVGLPGHGWLLDTKTALPSIMAMDVWASIGYYMVLFLAGLETIPRDLYEAAALDGGGRWAALRYVTLPLIRPVALFVIVINTIRSFQVFIEIFVMTRGGPLDTTLTAVYYLYDRAFFAFRMGYASAVAYLLFGVILAVALVQMRTLRAGRGVAA